MARVKLEFPDRIIFATEINVRITDLNYGGHMGNDTFLSIAHEARMQFLRTAGWDMEKRSDGFGIIMVDAVIVYKAEVFYSDSIRVELGVADMHPIGFDLHYRMHSLEKKKEVAAIKTGILGFDYLNRKVQKLPAEFVEFLTGPH